MTRLLAVWSALVGATICRHNGHELIPLGRYESCTRCGYYQDRQP